MNFDDLTPEQKERAKALKTPEELLAFVKEEGFELSDEELDAVAGGKWSGKCPRLECVSQTCIALNCDQVTCSDQFCPLL